VRLFLIKPILVDAPPGCCLSQDPSPNARVISGKESNILVAGGTLENNARAKNQCPMPS
jgi:hypothetical protein